MEENNETDIWSISRGHTRRKKKKVSSNEIFRDKLVMLAACAIAVFAVTYAVCDFNLDIVFNSPQKLIGVTILGAAILLYTMSDETDEDYKPATKADGFKVFRIYAFVAALALVGFWVMNIS